MGRRRDNRLPERRRAGFSLVEVLIVVAITGLLMTVLGSVVSQSMDIGRLASAQNDLDRQARFAAERITASLHEAPRILLPRRDNPATAQQEAVGGVLALVLSPAIDRDRDGIADADNDQDGLIDEDTGVDSNGDGAAGVVGADDDGDGLFDEGGSADDDEDSVADEDPVNGVDDDGDGAVDEDGGNAGDDDSDGYADEDWVDTVVYFLNGATLIERMPNVHGVNGADYTERVIADHVSQFRVERVTPGASGTDLIELRLELSHPDAAPVAITTRVRVNG